MLRTIEMHSVMEPEALYNFRQKNFEVFNSALGYLQNYALDAYNHVWIMIARDGEITACYRHMNGETELRKFVMGGIPHHEDDGTIRYSFHS